LRWAKWEAKSRTIEAGLGPRFVANDKCIKVFLYIPASITASTLVFGEETVPSSFSEALDLVSARAVEKRTPLPVLLEQAVHALESAAHEENWWADKVGDNKFDDVINIAAQNERVLDLLVCFAAAASRSLRRISLFDPFPWMFLDRSGGKDFACCMETMNTLPPLKKFRAILLGSHEPNTKLALFLRWLWDLKGVTITVSLPQYLAEMSVLGVVQMVLHKKRSKKF
jgi:hypothetical protein